MPIEEFEVTVFEETQARQFIAAVRGNRYEALYLLAITMGLRKGELLALRWSDLDMKGGELSVTRTQVRTGAKISTGPTKTRKSKRSLQLPSFVLESLRQHSVRQKEERLAASRWDDPSLVFATRVGTLLTPWTLTREFQRLLRRAGLPVVRFHDLRHSAATIMLAMGVDLKVISEILGHSDIRITANLYIHRIKRLHEDVAQKMDDLYGPSRPKPEAGIELGGQDERGQKGAG